MKLASFVESGAERFGLVLAHPATGETWVFEPQAVQERVLLYASRGTSPLHGRAPRFFDGTAPKSLPELLALESPGMDAMRRMQDFLARFLEQADAYILRGAGFPLHSVRLLAPIPRPRLFFGLVQNSPTAWRNDIRRTHLNLFPQGHQRPQGTVLGPGDPVVLPAADTIEGGWNPELGVIIGRGGRDIPVSDALAHVAGLTIVSDVTFDYFRQDYFRQPPPQDWFEDAMSSWGDKKADARTPMGPYLVTLDEIGNPYDLLIYTRQSGYLRDRSHTGAMALGIERTVHWLSTIRALQPGDVIHLGTMGYDGSPHLSSVTPTADDTIESEIEKVGVLRNPLVIAGDDRDWRDPQDEARRIHPAPAVRRLIQTGQTAIERESWHPGAARHFWIVFGSDAAAPERDQMQRRPYPRFLNAPGSALAAGGATALFSGPARHLRAGCELACVIGRLTTRVTVAEAADAILGFAPLVAVQDLRLADAVIEPASMQERSVPYVYARWHDGTNLIGTPASSAAPPPDANCRLEINGVGTAEGSTGEYSHSAAEVIAYISRYITLFPGDVVTLGRLGEVIDLDIKSPAVYSGRASIDGVGSLTFQIELR